MQRPGGAFEAQDKQPRSYNVRYSFGPISVTKACAPSATLSETHDQKKPGGPLEPPVLRIE